MSITVIVTFVSVVVIGLTVFARSELFRPKVRSAYSSNPFVRAFMDLSAFLCSVAAFELWGYGGPMPDGVAWVMAAFAVTSTVMLASMLVHDGRLVVAEARAEDVGAVKAAVHEALPDALDKANARLLDRIDPDVPGYHFPND